MTDYRASFDAYAQRVQALKHHCTSELSTRSVLIDRFLIDVLGWETSDPAQVDIEHEVRQLPNPVVGKVDYALLHKAEPAVLVEAKRLGQPLNDAHESQLIRYLDWSRASLGILTNGEHWRFYARSWVNSSLGLKPFLEWNSGSVDYARIYDTLMFRRADFNPHRAYDLALARLSFDGSRKTFTLPSSDGQHIDAWVSLDSDHKYARACPLIEAYEDGYMGVAVDGEIRQVRDCTVFTVSGWIRPDAETGHVCSKSGSYQFRVVALHHRMIGDQCVTTIYATVPGNAIPTDGLTDSAMKTKVDSDA